MEKRTVSDTVSDSDALRPYTLTDGISLDKAWARFVTTNRGNHHQLVLSLRNMSFIDHDALLFIGALVRFRELHGFETKLELPKEDSAWEFLRAWRFPEFLSAVGHRPFESYLTARDLARYLRDRTQFPRYVKVIDLPSGGAEELLSTQSFWLTPIRLDYNPMRSATLAQNRWLERHLVSVLNAYLNGEGDSIGKMVVLEAVLNAAMHPDATLAYTSAQIVMPRRNESAEPRLQIGIWDDGQPMASTLRSTLNRGESITSPAFGAIEESFRVRLVRSNGREDIRLLSPSEANLRHQVPWLSVAAFMSGVSSKPERQSISTGDHIRRPFSDENYPGMGLRYIRRYVLDLWNGEIRYWFNHYRMVMRSSEEPNVYDVSLFYRPTTSWPLQGNLLYLDIPLTRPPVE